MKLLCLVLNVLAQNDEDDDTIRLEELSKYRDSGLIGARGLSVFDSEFTEERLNQLELFVDDLSAIARRREEKAYELGLTASFTSEYGLDSEVMLPEMLRFYLNQYTFDMVPSKVKVRRMLQSGCWCQLLDYKEGKGKPKNQFDSFCQQWQQCKQCMGEENCENRDKTLPAGSKFPYKVDWSKKAERFSCKLVEDGCAKNSCLCDEQLAFQLAEAEDLFDPTLSQDVEFPFEQSCQWNILRTRPDEKNEKFCCGVYPNRHTFPVVWKEKERCCVDNKVSKKCG